MRAWPATTMTVLALITSAPFAWTALAVTCLILWIISLRYVLRDLRRETLTGPQLGRVGPARRRRSGNPTSR